MSAFEESKRQLEQPVPPTHERTKICKITGVPVKKDGKWVYEEITKFRHFDMILRRWVGDSDLTKKKDIPVEEKGNSKSVTVKVLLVRTALDPIKMRNVSAPFLVTLEAKISDDPIYEDCYFSLKKPEIKHTTHISGWIKGCIILNDFGKQSCEILPFNHRFIKQVGEEKRITPKEAQRMIENLEVYDMFSEDLSPDKEIKRTIYQKVL